MAQKQQIILYVRVTAQFKRQIERAAAYADQTVSGYVRTAVREKMERDKETR